MQNKCNCQNAGFVPVSGNWDFSMNGDCGCNGSGYNSRVRRRSNHGSKQCGEYEKDNTRGSDNRSGYHSRSGSDCQCERCDDARTAECCEQNTYVRDMDDCECNSTYTRTRTNGCNDCESGYQRERTSGCNQCESGYQRERANGCNDCESGYQRERANGCNDCESGYQRERTSGCNQCESGYSRARKNRGVGMMKGVMQEIDEIFQSESALRAGTLFPELHKPLNGYCPYEANCGTCAQQAAFAAWELRLYLNTHPNDEEAMKLFRKLCKEAEEENYATTFLTDDCCASGWSWVENPWPWEYSCQCQSGSGYDD